MASITLKQAKTVLSAAEEKAIELGVAMNIAVGDAGNNLTAFVRQDGAWLGAIGVSGGEVDQDHAVAEAGVAALAGAG